MKTPIEVPPDIRDYLAVNDSGQLIWIKTTHPRITLGAIAGSIQKSTGYQNVKFRGRNYRAHRVVFFLHHGWCPAIIDHIDGDRLNNQISNLRPALHKENIRNSKVYENNTSGVKGVRATANGTFQASLMLDGKTVFSGTFPNKSEAIAARRMAEIKYHGVEWTTAYQSSL